MTEEKKPRRRPRSDGQRNRENLLNVAKAAFTAGEIDIPLDEVARRAGVGIGTLYRHFPNRDALIEAVYRAELDRLADAAPVLAAQYPPVEALRAWMRLFVDYIAAKLVIAPALNGLAGGTGTLYAQSGTVLQGAIDGLVAAAVASGDISADIEPVDLLRALAGVSNYAAGPGWETSAKRLVDILIAGSRASAS
ncbi:TetR family transcriptional regulator [Komagataeibacter nataicola]|uniref:TetR family transcriptional regulator n=1 Tax=Komagataeibacter nataicola TaxID=265960 RepID=A0A9N7CF72_9PROT|nr:TetR/AcrR family transcriptional regulator [Komagataeibacter nataicola]AQU86435.1 TetR family transcriptional regulator [Komagataeibacter nataicola]PYD65289.1 TetR family transcriptional regulator [Komagataeibacter nataicola]WEQ56669.1 TetR/AcrR family transcriptional regulator [Komagataeibacter nataicola]GBR15498.1 TetR family transcriptional regulator [Komagataeibacter nataicola NRIC 0616]